MSIDLDSVNFVRKKRRFFKSSVNKEVLYRFQPFKNEVTSGFPNSNSNTTYPAFEVIGRPSILQCHYQLLC